MFQTFLEELANCTWPAGEKDFADCYVRVATKFALRGAVLNSPPTLIFRYILGAGFLRYVRDDLEKAGYLAESDKLGALVDEAEAGRRAWSDVEIYVRKDRVWSRIQAIATRLTGSPSMFVTFPGMSDAERSSAMKVWSALALAHPGPSGAHRPLLEVRYEWKAGDELHMPTAADAGWFKFFKCAAPGEPHGWTSPHHSGHSPQPEAVQLPQSIQRVKAAGDFRILPP